jgi:cystathionine beta-lyase/cystathionine gamma-synthase
MDVVDLEGVCDIARKHGITSVVDNAFATPCFSGRWNSAPMWSPIRRPR